MKVVDAVIEKDEALPGELRNPLSVGIELGMESGLHEVEASNVEIDLLEPGKDLVEEIGLLKVLATDDPDRRITATKLTTGTLGTVAKTAEAHGRSVFLPFIGDGFVHDLDGLGIVRWIEGAASGALWRVEWRIAFGNGTLLALVGWSRWRWLLALGWRG